MPKSYTPPLEVIRLFKPRGLKRDEYRAFCKTLKSPSRTIRIRAKLYNKDEKPLPIKLLLDADGGEVVVDTSQTPTRVATINLVDANRRLPVDGSHTADGRSWFAKFIGIEWGIYVRDVGWVDIPIFRGNIVTIERSGPRVIIEARGKEGQHVGDYRFPKSYSAREGTRIWRAIRKIFVDRGETRFDLNQSDKRLKKTRSFPIGSSPWRAAKGLAQDLADKQLFFQGNGVLRLRNKPTKPVWKFQAGQDATILASSKSFSLAGLKQLTIVKTFRTVKRTIRTKTELTTKKSSGATTLVVASDKHIAAGRKLTIGSGDYRETKTVASSYVSGTTIDLQDPLTRNHPKGAAVRVRHTQKRKVPVFGRYNIPAHHRFSNHALTGGYRPTVHMVTRKQLGSKQEAQDKARELGKESRGGIGQEVAQTTIVIPHLQELDVYVTQTKDGHLKQRAKQFVIPLSLGGQMEHNWGDKRVPFPGWRYHHDDIGTPKVKMETEIKKKK